MVGWLWSVPDLCSAKPHTLLVRLVRRIRKAPRRALALHSGSSTASTGLCLPACQGQPQRRAGSLGHFPGGDFCSLTLKFLLTAQGMGESMGPIQSQSRTSHAVLMRSTVTSHGPLPPNPSREQPRPCPDSAGTEAMGPSFTDQQPQARSEPAWEQPNTTSAKPAPASAGLRLVFQ